MNSMSSKRFPLVLSLALLGSLLGTSLADATPTRSSAPEQFRALIRADGTAERALFHAETDFKRCLWSTDGTPAGTFRLESDGQCLPIRHRSTPIFAVADGVGYLFVGPLALRPWRSDGTAAGTWPLIDFTYAARWDFSRGPELLHSSALDLVFFLADDGVHGIEPWVSDGTPGGARLLAEVASEPEEGHAFHLQEVGEQVLFFRPLEGEHELWRSDGTSSGTRPVAPITDGDPGTAPSRLYPVTGGAVFFLAKENGCAIELWRTDGTAAGTAPLGLFDQYHCSGPGQAFSFARLPGSVFFTASRSGDGGEMLWRTDGSADGTWAITNSRGVRSLGLEGAVEFGGHLYFAASDGDRGNELWRTDGTPASGEVFAELCPGICSSDPRNFHAAGDFLSFFARDEELGSEPWVSDGTTAGTRRLADLCPGSCSSVRFGDRGILLGDSVLFVRHRIGHGDEPWSLSLPAGAAVRLTEAHPGRMENAALIGDLAVFAAGDEEHGFEPWVTDGTAAGTRLLSDAEPAPLFEAAPPERLSAQPLGGGHVRLTWQDLGAEDAWGFEAVSLATGQVVVELRVPANATVAEIELPDGTYRIHGFGLTGDERTEESVGVVVQAGPCVGGGPILCLAGGRFRVTVDWHNPGAPTPVFSGIGQASAVPALFAGDDSGSFWFFTSDNLELVVKVLDGTSINGHFWLFWGSLTSVEYRIDVEDTLTGSVRSYHKPLDQICGGSDTTAFAADIGAGTSGPAASGFSASWPAHPSAAAPSPAPFAVASGPATRFVALDAPASVRGALHPPQPCVPDEETLCLLDGMLAVTVDWADQHNGGSGIGHAVPYTELTGFFWFFRPDNVELMVKALDGRTVNGKIWVFYGALTDVGYAIRVENREDGHAVRTYESPPGVICGRGDTAAF